MAWAKGYALCRPAPFDLGGLSRHVALGEKASPLPSIGCPPVV